MALSLLIAKQLLIMFSFSGIGFLMAKKQRICHAGCADMVNLLLYVVIPFTVLNSFIVPSNAKKTEMLWESLFFSLIAFLVSMGIAYLIYGKNKRVENFSSAFSNAGFIGIPLVQATLGSEAVFYIAGYVAFLNIFQWIYGAYIMSGDKKMMSLRAIAGNAVLLSFLIGITLYLTGWTELTYIKSIAGAIAQMNSPLAMIIIGVYMSQVSMKKMLKHKSTYMCCIVRLLVIPLLSLVVVALLPLHSRDVAMAVMIVLSAPVGANVAMFAQKFQQDQTYAVEIVILSTIISIVTLPCLMYITQIIL